MWLIGGLCGIAILASAVLLLAAVVIGGWPGE
jgi:hypothetical protein